MPGGEPAGATHALADAVRGIRYEDMPEDAREVARQCLLDFLGCALAGSREPLADILVAEIVRYERGTEAGLIGRAADPRDAIEVVSSSGRAEWR